jgi:hypothetical protein
MGIPKLVVMSAFANPEPSTHGHRVISLPRRQRLDQLCIPLRYLVATVASLTTIRFW